MVAIDPLLILATVMQSSRGVYALLLGSGVSRGAGIPTGWEVTLDLIRRVAEQQGEDCGPSPDEWFHSRFGSEPSYSRLLGELGRTPAERRQLLRAYFEPTEDEASEGLKTPGPAHEAIADLVKRGHLRVLLTTNFDRLLERALDKEGIVPQVVASADAVKGMFPLAHSDCTLVKLHGDYLDARILNTEEELAGYPRPLQRLLDQVLDEYGLVVCGWSGEWDVALRRSLERRANRRFSTFWTLRGQPRETTGGLIAGLGAQTVSMTDADDFFTRLDEALIAIDDLATPHPVSRQIAVATLKRYLAEPGGAIRATDLVNAETHALVERIDEDEFPFQGGDQTSQGMDARLRRYEAAAHTVAELMANGCYWSGADLDGLWTGVLRRAANSRDRGQGWVPWVEMRLYPALLLMYAGGIASIARGDYVAMASLLLRAAVRDGREKTPCAQALHTLSVMQFEAQKFLPGMKNHKTPLSERLSELMRDWLKSLIADPAENAETFDLFEYFLGLVHYDLELSAGGYGWGPIGCFTWRGRHLMDRSPLAPAKLIDEQQASAGAEWEPLAAGFFGGSEERYRTAKTGFDEFALEASVRLS